MLVTTAQLLKLGAAPILADPEHIIYHVATQVQINRRTPCSFMINAWRELPGNAALRFDRVVRFNIGAVFNSTAHTGKHHADHHKQQRKPTTA